MRGGIKKSRSINLKSIVLMIYAILLVVLFFSTQTYFGTENYNRIYIIETVFITTFMILLVAANHGKIHLKKSEMQIYGVFLFPYIGLFAISAIEYFLLKKITFITMVRYSLQPLLICMMAIMTYSMFRKKTIHTIIAASIVNYSVYIVTCMVKYGVLSIFGAGSDNEASQLLEVHEITFIFGLLAVYLWITKSGTFKLQEKYQKVLLIVTILMSLLGFKRILIAVMIAVLLLNVILKKVRTSRLLMILTVLTIVFCFLWCYFCSSAILFEELSVKFGIDFKGRNWIYANFYPYYDFAVDYIGGGIGYVQHLIGSMKNMYLNGHFIGLHNEVLRLYIDLGFVPYLAYLLIIFPLSTKYIINNKGYRSGACYFIFWIMTFFCSTTDNLLTYPNYMLVFITVTIHCVFEEQQKNEIGRRKNENRNSNSL